MGTAVIGGMATASGIAIFIIPALFYLVEKLGGTKQEGARVDLTTTPERDSAGDHD
jgi:hypothetical protein